MKTQLFLISILLLVLTSCNETVIDPKVPIDEDTTTYPDCPHYDNEKYFDPIYDEIFSVSHDGKYAVIRKHFDGNSNPVTISSRFLLNLQTGEYMLVGGNENGKLGGTGRAFEFDTLQFPYIKRILPFERFQFCPYNSDLICFRAACDIDTVGERKKFSTFYNLFSYNIKTKELKLITPSSFGKWGHSGNGFTVPLWLTSSTEGNNKFLLGTNDGTYIYSQQEDKLEKIPLGNFTIISSDLSKRFYVYGNGYLPNQFYLNDKQVFLSDSMPIKTIQSGSFTHDNKLLALFVWANNGELDTALRFRNAEIWLIEVDKLIASTGEFTEIRKIKPLTPECQYFADGGFFTPQNTLIVGMHPYNSPQGNVYEMDLKGNILRKITNN